MSTPSLTHVAASPTYRLLLTFDNGETRVFDMTFLVEGPFSKLKGDAFLQVRVVNGDLDWNDGDSLSTASLYRDSTPC